MQTQHEKYRKRHKGLLSKVIFVTVLTTTLTLLFFGVYQYQVQKQQLSGLIQEQIQQSFERLTANLRQSLFDYDREASRGSILAEMKTDEILAVFVVYEDRIVHGYMKNEAGEIVPADTLPEAKGNRVLTREIMVEEITLGELRLFYTYRYLHQALQHLVLSLAVQILVIGLLIILALSIFFRYRVIGPMAKVIAGLSESHALVLASSDNIASHSQALAESASEQASALEESSSSLEEMASMTGNNSDRAVQANSLMKETRGVVQEASRTVSELTASMSDISRAGEETQKIVKTIDEIAFQTNLLALNAAVEAARAGEAGAGFAVVADEVRNLALRATDAAKNTAQLIAGTVNNLKQGSAYVTRTHEAFERVADSSARVSDLIEEIAQASREQTQGIDELNSAVSEIDKLTQHHVAGSEESASAAHEIHAQAENLKRYIEELAQMLGRGVSSGGSHEERKDVDIFEERPARRSKEPVRKKRTEITRHEVRPDQVIPFDDENDFSDF